VVSMEYEDIMIHQKKDFVLLFSDNFILLKPSSLKEIGIEYVILVLYIEIPTERGNVPTYLINYIIDDENVHYESLYTINKYGRSRKRLVVQGKEMDTGEGGVDSDNPIIDKKMVTKVLRIAFLGNEEVLNKYLLDLTKELVKKYDLHINNVPV
jgi:hypothetical protein